MTTPPDVSNATAEAAAPQVLTRWERQPLWLRFAAAVWKISFGALCGMSFFLSFLAVGWAQRAAQREVVRTWWRHRAIRLPGESFAQFASASGRTRELAGWPNWFSGDPGPGVLQRFPRLWQRLFGSLLANARIGLAGAFNVAVFTLPGGLLWSFGWYAGWMNSFHKGYENYLVGISVFIVGILLFIASMLYVPLALARQSSTGRWRSFYDFALVWKLVQRRWMSQLGLALLALALGFPLSVFRSIPQFLPQMNSQFLNWTAYEQVRFLESYFFLTAFYGFSAFVVFRLAAARVYAGALSDAVQRGVIVQEELADREWEALHQLGLISLRPARPHHWILRGIRWVGTRASRTMAAIATVIVWFFFIFNIMTSEFLSYHSAGRGWWNQPLIQLPWFDYTPLRLHQEAAREARGETESGGWSVPNK